LVANTIIQSGAVFHGVIHFSDRLPVRETPCGKLGPAAAEWRYVTCLDCLRRAPRDPRIAARLEALIREAADRAAGSAREVEVIS
jgi:hypothetical protein